MLLTFVGVIRLTNAQLIQSENQPFLSTASLWEIAIKLRSFSQPFETASHRCLNGIDLLGIRSSSGECSPLPSTIEILLTVCWLQAMVEQMPILSADPAFDAYQIQRLW
jgi:hypothetical protein